MVQMTSTSQRAVDISSSIGPTRDRIRCRALAEPPKGSATISFRIWNFYFVQHVTIISGHFFIYVCVCIHDECLQAQFLQLTRLFAPLHCRRPRELEYYRIDRPQLRERRVVTIGNTGHENWHLVVFCVFQHCVERCIISRDHGGIMYGLSDSGDSASPLGNVFPSTANTRFTIDVYVLKFSS